MQAKLGAVVRRTHLKASITAGLGSVFVALGDKYLKPNGRLALVLPRSLLSGVAWQKTRELFADEYHLEYIIVSHDPQRWNFSENTNLGETLILARRRNAAADPTESTLAVNLWRQPNNAIEALHVGQAILDAQAPDVFGGAGVAEIFSSGTKCGELLSVPWSILSTNLWLFPVAFAQTELTEPVPENRTGV